MDYSRPHKLSRRRPGFWSEKVFLLLRLHTSTAGEEEGTAPWAVLHIHVGERPAGSLWEPHADSNPAVGVPNLGTCRAHAGTVRMRGR